MATRTAGESRASPQTKEGQSVSRLSFDWLILGLSLWLIAGAALDGWAHTHIARLETFFTPWHAVLYSGFLAVATGLTWTVVRNHSRGSLWTQAIPAGYELSVLGVVIFAVSGVGDMIWHLLFGIEKSIEALLSPTHLGLALGSALIVSGPLRAAWRRPDDGTTQRWRQLGPAILSLALLFSVFTYFTEYAHPFVYRWPLSHPVASSPLTFWGPALGVEGILLQSGILMGVVLFALRRWQLPLGTWTLVFTLDALVMTAFSYGPLYGLPVALLGGAATDVLLKVLAPSEQRQGELRLFAFAVPSMLYLLYFLSLQVLGRLVHASVTWSIHLWLGSTFLAGIVGLLLSYAMFPPAKPHAGR